MVNTKFFIVDECKICDVITKHKNKQKCSHCIFVADINSNQVYTNGVLKQFGIRPLRKHHFFFFIYHPELQWKFPLISSYDLEGNKTRENEYWNIHHEDCNHLNDNKWNLILLFNSEHVRFHRTINNPMDNPDVVEKIRNFQRMNSRRKIKDGTHLFITNNPVLNFSHPVYKQTNKVKEWLDIDHGIVQVDKKLANQFGYSERYMLTNVIEKIIREYDLNISVRKIFYKPTNSRLKTVEILWN